ncbi:uncharacterized protein SPSK_06244 [Sporothrix schenckii 1099-18]|uniref:Tat pathway signal sequence n=1 Tax=Sporothrix schenckii 1099-18 TaxID=1397361 RepID=A0A0F2MJ88_SPOSC|nr:uncharacterized protein SPSK_06244 [Sporothrix schenckii 1099-18]KJR89119.1 hypothetical protein SPSK_06244 [Sporothrix schenckii 1099-18]
MAPSGRRASMRSVRTLPIVHEDDDMVVVPTPESAAMYPVRQNRHSGIVTALPTLQASDGGEGAESGSGGSAGSGSDEEADSSQSPSPSPSQSHNSSPSRSVNRTPRAYRAGSIGSYHSQGSLRSYHSQHSQHSQQSQHSQHSQRQHPTLPVGPLSQAYHGPNYPYVNPACSESSEESGITDRKLEEQMAGAGGAGGRGLPKRAQDRQWFSKRGGWWRLILTLLLLAVIAVGLGVGLKFGLQQANNNNNSSGGDSKGGDGDGAGTSTSPPATPATPSDQFPAGRYSFTVALTNVSTACTTNGFAFGCAPSSNNVFSASGSPAAQNASAVTLEWIIAGTTGGSTSSASTITTYTISSSSSSSSASPSFSSIYMTLLDTGLPSERLVFNFSMDLAYVPTSDLVDHQTSAATCYFNQTILQATLWTQRRATFPPTIANVPAPTEASTSAFVPWPFAVEIAQVQQAGPAIPDCVDYHGNSLGDFSVPDGGAADVCGCWYSNMVGGGSTNGTSTR